MKQLAFETEYDDNLADSLIAVAHERQSRHKKEEQAIWLVITVLAGVTMALASYIEYI